MSEKSSSGFLPLIQILRAFAAFTVVFGHTQHEAFQIAEKTGQAFSEIRYHFDLGIHVFFVISGFVIVYTGQRFAENMDGVKTFLWRRVIRIVPLYWFYTSLMILALFLFPGAIETAKVDIWHFIKSYLFIPHERPGDGSVRPVLSLGWTLNYEMFFYAVFALLLFLPFEKAMKGLYIVFPLIVAIGFFIPEEQTILHFWSRPIILEFLAGAVIAHLKLHHVQISKRAGAALCALGFAFMVALIWTLESYHLHDPINLFLKGGAGAMLVAAATLTIGAKNLNPSRILTALGNSSYTLYLAHPFILGVAKLFWVRIAFLEGLNLWVYVGVSTLACLIGAHIAYLIIEKPVLEYLKSRKRNRIEKLENSA